MIDPARPFVLLDAGDGRRTRLFRHPVSTIVARDPADVAPALEALRGATKAGLHAAGYLGYEAGLALEPKLRPLAPEPSSEPLLWFGLFERVELLDETGVEGLLRASEAWIGPLAPRIDQSAHAAMVARAHGYIAAGDIYQANVTFPARLPFAGGPLALYARLRAARAGHWGGLLFDGARWLLSFSPELFFTLAGRRLVARPMKGTAARAGEDAEDADRVRSLRADPKERAENLMIVDLLRNDLTRVAAPGSVAVPSLFDVETYPTVHQMTSTVTADLAPGLHAVDILARIFPCGSVTGAPKIRAMEIIAELETAARGAYTGSMGWLSPDGDAAFNVAIRTLTVNDGATFATLGLGSGIVADSDAAAEWRECLSKGAFLSTAATPFDLIETMRFDAVEGLVDVERHLARIKASAETLGFLFDRHDVRNELQAATFRLRDDRRVRLRASRSGAVAIEVRPLPGAPDEPVDVTVRPLPVAPDDLRLRHKTSARDFYDGARRAAGTFEVVFTDPAGRLTEGSFTNIFVEREGRLLTPPLARGLLPGILRARLLEEGRAHEADLFPADLAGGFLIGNGLRGLIRARLVAGAGGTAL